MIDATHDPALRSWVPSADGHADFPVQNLPLGRFAPQGADARGGVAIGDYILDLGALANGALLRGEARAAAAAAAAGPLNALLALGAPHRRALRSAISALLSQRDPPREVRDALHPASNCSVLLPCEIGDYTDFYAGIHHAEAVGKLFRPDAPLLPNYKYVPIAYHGRASSIRPSGAQVRRPSGQIKPPDRATPSFEPTRRLDFELELGIWVGLESALSAPIAIDRAPEHIGGYCLLNDWSARDMQAWEYQPLGPFLAKNFMTTVSPWIVSPEALEPFRIRQAPRPATDPKPLSYLWDEADQAAGAFDVELSVHIRTETMRRAGTQAQRISTSNTRHLYWTVAQMLTHHTSGGCNLRPGDLLGSGTISDDANGCGSLLELSRAGAVPLELSNGERRAFLLDGDEIILKARAVREGFASIGFGDCRGIVAASDAGAQKR